jgi:hypothetical protein
LEERIVYLQALDPEIEIYGQKSGFGQPTLSAPAYYDQPVGTGRHHASDPAARLGENPVALFVVSLHLAPLTQRVSPRKPCSVTS